MLKVKFKSNANCVKEKKLTLGMSNPPIQDILDLQPELKWRQIYWHKRGKWLWLKKKKKWDPKESDTDNKLHIIEYFTTLGPQRIQCSKLIQTQKGLWQSTKV